MDKRYQVFVSSTYTDLQEERRKVIQALMEMDCIPAGMELFPAADEEQWEFIKKVINDCDYYILIIGGRYGSLTAQGISYTEKEYEYALSIGLQVLAFVHESPDDIPVAKSDIDPVLRQKLDTFRSLISANRLVKYWKSAAELPGLVALSVSKAVKMHPAIGWVRASNVPQGEILLELNEVRKENNVLKARMLDMESEASQGNEHLAGLDEKYKVRLEFRESLYGEGSLATEIEVSWGEIFASVAPSLISYPVDEDVAYTLGSLLYRRLEPGSTRTVQVQSDNFQTIRIQFEALGLIEVKFARATRGDMALFWGLTTRGKRLMTTLRTIKSASDR